MSAGAQPLRTGVCNGAILRAPLSNPNAVEPFSWGYRNGYAIRFAPNDHPLAGGLLVGENGADDAGARPSNNAPDALHLARQNPDGTPDYHGWPDRYGFLPTSQAVFNPIGGPAEELCVFVGIRDEQGGTESLLAALREYLTIPGFGDLARDEGLLNPFRNWYILSRTPGPTRGRIPELWTAYDNFSARTSAKLFPNAD